MNSFMKNKRSLKFILIIIIVFSWVNTTLLSQTGYIKIVSPDSGLIVTIDDSVFAKTPSEPFALEKGNHRIGVSNPRKGLWHYNDWTSEVTIEPGDTLIVAPEFKKNIIIRTNPFEAGVYLNDKYLGTTPLYHEVDDPANSVFLLKKLNHVSFIIETDTLTKSTINIELKPIEEQLPLVVQGYLQNEVISGNKKVVYSLFALTIASGFSAAYLKDRADKKYSQYVSAGSLHKMNKYYDDSKKLDNYSSISLGLFEVSFVVSLYYLIKKSEY